MITQAEVLRRKIQVDSDNGDVKVARVRTSTGSSTIGIQVLGKELILEGSESEKMARVNEIIDMLKWIKTNTCDLP